MTISDQVWFWASVAVSPVVGSFIALASIRMPERRPIALARSACDHCGRTLQPLELVPILSFLALRGRCRTCRAPIPRAHMVIESLSLAAAVWGGLVFAGPMVLINALLAWQLLLLAALDVRSLWLPRVLTLPLAASGLVVSAVRGEAVAGIIGAAAGFAAMALVAWGYRRLRGREGLGGGDAYLLGGVGAWIGWMGLPSALVLASASGLVLALLAKLAGRPIASDQPLPFGAFIALGGWLVWLYGPLGLH